jgi:hypothetical protein
MYHISYTGGNGPLAEKYRRKPDRYDLSRLNSATESQASECILRVKMAAARPLKRVNEMIFRTSK